MVPNPELGQDTIYGSSERGAPIALDILDSVIQYRVQAGFVFVLVALVGIFFAAISPSVYVADTLIQVEDKKANPMQGMQQIAQALNVGENNIQGELDILKSRDVLDRAINVLSLNVAVSPINRVPMFADRFERHNGGRGTYLAAPRFGMTDYQWGGEKIVISQFVVPNFFEGRQFILTIGSKDGWTLSDPNGSILATGTVGNLTYFNLGGSTANILVKQVFARPGEKFFVTKLEKYAAYRRIALGLNAGETVKQSGVIRVTYADDDPVQAVAVLGEIANAYVDQNISRGAEDASKALAFLERQLPQLKSAMEGSEEALSKYQISRQSISLDKEASSLLERSVNLGKARLDAEMKRGQLLQIFKPDHPQVQAVDQEIRQIQGDEAQLAGEVKRLPDTEQGLLALSRDVKINTDIYTALLASAEQYKVAKAGTIGNVRVVDAAAASPVPTKPNRTVLLGIALLAGIAAAVASTVVRRAVQPYFLSADEVEKKLALPVYGTIPESKVQSTLFVRRKSVSKASQLLHVLAPTDLAVESLRSLHVALQFAMSDTANKNILITGPTASLGKSFIAANLAAVLGASGKKVLLVDTDMRRPRLSAYFSVKQAPGLSDLLSGRNTLGELFNQQVVPGVDLITAGTKPPNPSELLVNGRISGLLDWAQSRYDIIILDSPPLLPVGDAVIVSKYVGAIFMVLRFEQSTPAEALESLRRLDNVGNKVKGVIFNGLKLDRLKYGYQYRRYYGYS
jgi:tyrosine-protein kinase Etk/Wzc